MQKSNRIQSIDILKGLLINLVVLGHSQDDAVKNLIFLFHMPLFFMISGLLINREKLMKIGYVLETTRRLMIPYTVYLVLDMLLVRHSLSCGAWAHAIYGGRAISGVYWYITCYLFALLLLSIFLRNVSDGTTKVLILAGGV